MANTNDKQPPAWMTGSAKPATPPGQINTNLPAAWHVGSSSPAPTPPAEQEPSGIFLPPPGPMSPPPIAATTPEVPLPPLPGTPSQPAAIPVVYTPPPATTTVSVPTSVTLPTASPATEVPTVFDWRPAVVDALRAVATTTANSQFAAWAAAPADIITLALSESSGDLKAVIANGYSTKLGRESYKFGLFGMNELWCPGHNRDAPGKIGNANAAKMVAFPQTATWSKAQAEKALLAWPAQLWYAMVLLRYYSLFKNTYFASVDNFVGGKCVATTVASRTKEREIAAAMVPRVNSIASTLKTPPSLVLLKAFWLASSPEGARNVLASGVDSRIASASQWYPGLASVPNSTAYPTDPHLVRT